MSQFSSSRKERFSILLMELLASDKLCRYLRVPKFSMRWILLFERSSFCSRTNQSISLITSILLWAKERLLRRLRLFNYEILVISQLSKERDERVLRASRWLIEVIGLFSILRCSSTRKWSTFSTSTIWLSLSMSFFSFLSSFSPQTRFKSFPAKFNTSSSTRHSNYSIFSILFSNKLSSLKYLVFRHTTCFMMFLARFNFVRRVSLGKATIQSIKLLANSKISSRFSSLTSSILLREFSQTLRSRNLSICPMPSRELILFLFKTSSSKKTSASSSFTPTSLFSEQSSTFSPRIQAISFSEPILFSLAMSVSKEGILVSGSTEGMWLWEILRICNCRRPSNCYNDVIWLLEMFSSRKLTKYLRKGQSVNIQDDSRSMEVMRRELLSNSDLRFMPCDSLSVGFKYSQMHSRTYLQPLRQRVEWYFSKLAWMVRMYCFFRKSFSSSCTVFQQSCSQFSSEMKMRICSNSYWLIVLGVKNRKRLSTGFSISCPFSRLQSKDRKLSIYPLMTDDSTTELSMESQKVLKKRTRGTLSAFSIMNPQSMKSAQSCLQSLTYLRDDMGSHSDTCSMKDCRQSSRMQYLNSSLRMLLFLSGFFKSSSSMHSLQCNSFSSRQQNLGLRTVFRRLQMVHRKGLSMARSQSLWVSMPSEILRRRRVSLDRERVCRWVLRKFSMRMGGECWLKVKQLTSGSCCATMEANSAIMPNSDRFSSQMK